MYQQFKFLIVRYIRPLPVFAHQLVTVCWIFGSLASLHHKWLFQKTPISFLSLQWIEPSMYKAIYFQKWRSISQIALFNIAQTLPRPKLFFASLSRLEVSKDLSLWMINEWCWMKARSPSRVCFGWQVVPGLQTSMPQ